jgi:predicted transport protein
MSTIEQQIANQVANIERATGRSLDGWIALIRGSGVDKHGQVVAWLKAEHGLGHGNANLLAVKAREAAAGGPVSDNDLVESMFSGKAAAVRALYGDVVDMARSFGTDVELAPKKTYVSLRRRKQFATVGPAAGQLEICLNLPGEQPTDRLRPMTGMATHKVRIADSSGLDPELTAWLRQAYERAG